MYFTNYRLWKTSLDRFVKSVVSEHALTVNMWKRPKYFRNLHDSALMIFFHYSQEFELEIASPSDSWNLRWGC